MSASTSDNGVFNGQFDARIFVAIFVPALFLFIIILTMIVFLIYREPSYYDSYIVDNETDYNDKSDLQIHKQTKLCSSIIPINPYRHFERSKQIWYNLICKGSFSVDNTTDYFPIETNMPLRSHRPHTAGTSHTKQNRSLSTHHRFESPSDSDDSQSDLEFEELLPQYDGYLLKKYQRPKIGLQHYYMREPSSKILRQSGIYRNAGLTPGQKLYLLDKCHIYDMEGSRKHRTNSYLQVLSKRFTEDLLYKPEFRLNDPQDYSGYAKFVTTPRPTARPINAGYFTPRQPHRPRVLNDQKKQHFNIRSNNHLDKKDFGFISNTNQKSAKENTLDLSRHLSGSSSAANIGNTTSFRPRQEPKEIPRISVRLS